MQEGQKAMSRELLRLLALGGVRVSLWKLAIHSVQLRVPPTLLMMKARVEDRFNCARRHWIY